MDARHLNQRATAYLAPECGGSQSHCLPGGESFRRARPNRLTELVKHLRDFVADGSNREIILRGIRHLIAALDLRRTRSKDSQVAKRRRESKQGGRTGLPSGSTERDSEFVDLTLQSTSVLDRFGCNHSTVHSVDDMRIRE